MLGFLLRDFWALSRIGRRLEKTLVESLFRENYDFILICLGYP